MVSLKFKAMMVLLTGMVCSTVAQAQRAGDLKVAFLQNGYSVTDLPLGDLFRATQAVRIILTTSDANVPGIPAISGLTNEGYAIQRVVDGAATTWWVIGDDAPGAMTPVRSAYPNSSQFIRVKQ